MDSWNGGSVWNWNSGATSAEGAKWPVVMVSLDAVQLCLFGFYAFFTLTSIKIIRLSRSTQLCMLCFPHDIWSTQEHFHEREDYTTDKTSKSWPLIRFGLLIWWLRFDYDRWPLGGFIALPGVPFLWEHQHAVTGSARLSKTLFLPNWQSAMVATISSYLSTP